MPTKTTIKKPGRPARDKTSLFAEIQRLKAQVKDKDSTIEHLKSMLNMEATKRRDLEYRVEEAKFINRVKYLFTKEV